MADYSLAVTPIPSASVITVSNSELDLIWNTTATGSLTATLNEYAGASCAGAATTIVTVTGNWGFQNYTELAASTAYSFNVTITDGAVVSSPSECVTNTTSGPTSAPFDAIAQGNTTISLPTTAGELIILFEGMCDNTPTDSQMNMWLLLVDGNAGDLVHLDGLYDDYGNRCHYHRSVFA